MPDRILALTFDCYGTLIDWESGLLAAFTTLLGPARVRDHRDEIIAAYARQERAIESGPYRLYRVVLEEIAGRVAMEFGVAITPVQRTRFANTITEWPAFPDTAPALQRLHRKYKLAIVSNVDDDLFAGTLPRLGIEPDAVVTARQVRSYKPARAHFDEVLKRLGLTPGQVLHVAESRYHDIEPAARLGFHTAWIDRHHADPDRQSASGSGDSLADITAPSLEALADELDA